MIPNVDPKVDYAFKHIFGREQNLSLLISLLDAVLQPPADRQITSLEVLNPFNDKEAIDDKLSILDIKACDQSGRQFNVEMQLLNYGAFCQRALYYWARLHQGQLQEGENYYQLRPTIGICFVNAPLFPQLWSYHQVFELRERQQGLLFTDQLALHILELRKFTKGPDELATPLDRWLYFLRHGQGLDSEALPKTLAVPEIQRALGDLIMMTQSELERQRYESRLKMQRDISTALQEAAEKGREEGERNGRSERVQSLQRLLRRPLTPLEALVKLPLTELQQLADQLEAEAASRLAGNGS